MCLNEAGTDTNDLTEVRLAVLAIRMNEQIYICIHWTIMAENWQIINDIFRDMQVLDLTKQWLSHFSKSNHPRSH